MGNEQSNQGKNKAFKSQGKPGIVVVSPNQQESSLKEDSNVAKLSICPTFNPLLSPSLVSADAQPLNADLIYPLDATSCLRIARRLQEHFEKCAEAVKFDQNSLVSQIKEVDRVSVAVMQRLTERQRAHAKHAEHARKVEEISASLNKIRRNIDQSLTVADELNMLLPVDQRLPQVKIF